MSHAKENPGETTPGNEDRYSDYAEVDTRQKKFDNDEGILTTAKPLEINSQTNGEEGIPVRQPNDGDYFIGSRFIYKSHTDGKDGEEPDDPSCDLLGGLR